MRAQKFHRSAAHRRNIQINVASARPPAVRRPKGSAAENRPLLLPTTADAAASDAPEPYTNLSDSDIARVDMPQPQREAVDVDISTR